MYGILFLLIHKEMGLGLSQRSIQRAINTNNGIERQNRSFKYDFLAKQRDTSLSGMLTVLVTQFLPSSFRRFVLCNSILFYFPSVDLFFHTLHFPHFLTGQ